MDIHTSVSPTRLFSNEPHERPSAVRVVNNRNILMCIVQCFTQPSTKCSHFQDYSIVFKELMRSIKLDSLETPSISIMKHSQILQILCIFTHISSLALEQTVDLLINLIHNGKICFPNTLFSHPPVDNALHFVFSGEICQTFSSIESLDSTSYVFGTLSFERNTITGAVYLDAIADASSIVQIIQRPVDETLINNMINTMCHSVVV